MRIQMGKRQVYIALAIVVAIVAFAYPHYFKWWDHRSCAQSGGTYSEAENACLEPRNADIPNTGKSLHSGGDNPRE